MIGMQFDGEAVEVTTSLGAKISVGAGYITPDEDSDPVQAIYTKVVAPSGETVTEYALTAESFGAYMEAVKVVFERFVPKIPNDDADE